jgi:hypothetical protein
LLFERILSAPSYFIKLCNSKYTIVYKSNIYCFNPKNGLHEYFDTIQEIWIKCKSFKFNSEDIYLFKDLIYLFHHRFCIIYDTIKNTTTKKKRLHLNCKNNSMVFNKSINCDFF